MNALVNTAKSYKNADLGLINKSINYNNNLRKDHNLKLRSSPVMLIQF
jgi:hypothetical protein